MLNLHERFDSIFIFISGKAVLVELKIKLLLSRDKHKVKKESCSKARNTMYCKYSEHISDEDKKIIDEAVWIRNKLAHFELSEILKKQKSISSLAVEGTIDPDNVLQSIKNMQEGKSKSISEKSSLFGQYLELGNNPERIKALDNLLDKAIKIINRITSDSIKFKNPMQQTSTYHLDQRVRGLISKGRIGQEFLDKYYPEKHEAILSLAVLEYAGIKIKTALSQIERPKKILSKKPLNLLKVKEYFDSQVEKKLSKNSIEEKLKERLKHDNEYAKLFATKCMEALSRSGFYELIVNQLSWDRFSQMKWIEDVSEIDPKEINKEIANLIVKDNHLYILRHCQYLSETPVFLNKEYNNEDEEFLMEIMKKVKIKSNMDIGDCELIHVAINGQSSGDLKKRKPVDCYTMDDAKEIKRRLISCIFFYQMLEIAPFIFNYKFDPTYFGKIYIIDSRGQQKEEIKVADYVPHKVLMRRRLKDLNTLSLLND